MRPPEEWVRIAKRHENGDWWLQLTPAWELADFQLVVQEIQRDAMPQWQPIETAPRDDTHILLYVPTKPGIYQDDSKSKPAIVRGYWNTSSNGWYDGEDGDWLTQKPTHWMPLPEPPK